jgi:hypothetical protein
MLRVPVSSSDLVVVVIAVIVVVVVAVVVFCRSACGGKRSGVVRTHRTISRALDYVVELSCGKQLFFLLPVPV